MFVDYGILTHTMMAKPIKSLELHYQMIRFLMKGMIAFDEVERKPDCALYSCGFREVAVLCMVIC